MTAPRDPAAVAFGQWLRSELDQRALPIQTFAEQIGIDRVSVHRWLRGVHRPRAHQLPALAAALGIELDLALAAAGYRPYDIVAPGAIHRQAAELIAAIPEELLISVLPMLQALARPESQAAIAGTLRLWSAHHDG